jgi:hypothetical protein
VNLQRQLEKEGLAIWEQVQLIDYHVMFLRGCWKVL